MKVSRGPLLIICLSIFATATIWNSVSYANACGEFIYNKKGKLGKYNYLPNTVSENTAKHGSSTSSGVSTESTTAVSDVGVSTGASQGWQQSSSTKGECKWMGLFASRDEYKDYLAQNMQEIKQEISKGEGGHLEILASAFECDSAGRKLMPSSLQRNLERFVDLDSKNSDQFVKALNETIEQEHPGNCHII